MALSFEDLRRLVEQSEDARVELKETPSDQVLRDFSTDIAAIANGKGGAIIFGITDAKGYVGCMLVGTERDRISQEAVRCRPPVQIDFDETASDDGKRFLVVRVPADPFSKWVFTTSPKDRERFIQLTEERPDLSLLDQVRLLAAEG